MPDPLFPLSQEETMTKSLKTIFLLLFLTVPAHGLESICSILVSELKPLQMEVGDDAVMYMLRNYLETHELNLRPFPAVVLPNGEIRISDGHHRARMFYWLEKKGYVPVGILKPNIKIVRNYQEEGMTLVEALKDLYSTGGLYLTKPYRELLDRGEVDWEDFFTGTMPHSIAELNDNPKRSLMGAVLHELKINSLEYTNFIEFYLAERLEADGFLFPNEISLADRRLIEEVKVKVLSPSIQDYLNRSKR